MERAFSRKANRTTAIDLAIAVAVECWKPPGKIRAPIWILVWSLRIGKQL